MLIDDQEDLIKHLSTPAAYGKGVKDVLVRQSHISVVFLAGDFAYKLKRGVKYPYVDYSTPDIRKEACAKEVEINKVFAPEVYLKTVPVYRSKSGKMTVEKAGSKEDEIIDTLIVMKRFPEEDIFENLAAKGKLDRFEMMDLAETVASLHERSKKDLEYGGKRTIQNRLAENISLMRCFIPHVFSKKDIDLFETLSSDLLSRYGDLLDARRNEGKVRNCHGDLHFHNIVLLDKKPVPFDAIEFNDELTKIDTLYDVSFLLMDMENRGLKRLSSIFFNHYMAYSNDWEGLPALPLFLACRASVLSYVMAVTSQEQETPRKKETMAKAAADYLALGIAFLNPPPPVLVACGGLSGSGKSRMAREIAPFIGSPPGAVILRTDVLRKRLKGVKPHEKLEDEDYNPDSNRKTYESLREECIRVLKTGQSVIADGIFANMEERVSIENLAKELGVGFAGFWMDAPIEVRAERVISRKRNPSDVKTKERAEKQLTWDTGEITWNQIDTSGKREETMKRVKSILEKNFPKLERKG